MKIWTFKSFLKKTPDKAIDVIEDWLNEQPLGVRSRLERTIAYLEVTKTSWPSQFIRQYKGHQYLYEFIIYVNKVQYRPFGCFGPGPREFTLLIGAKEIGGKINPSSTPKAAEERKKIIDNDRSYLDDFKFGSKEKKPD